jgi:hypothetical protein
MIYFNRQELARLSGFDFAALQTLIKRDQVPTLIDDRARLAMTAFDALVLTAADFLCRDGGYDRGFGAKALHQHLDELYRLAERIDRNEPGIAVMIGQTVDRECHVAGGAFGDLIAGLPKMMPKGGLARMTFVSLNSAANAVRERAHKAGLELGRFAMTPAEVAEIAALPFGRGVKVKPKVKV